MNRKIKCVIWDLDNTIWNGILLEDENIYIKKEVLHIIKELDKRGILQSIASKNNYNLAIQKLEEYNIREYFLYPQICWDDKSQMIKKIRDELNISYDSIMFIDDNSFELEEVKYHIKEIYCLHNAQIEGILAFPELTPQFITEDSRKRRLMYICDMKRKDEEKNFSDSKIDFLKQLNMVFEIDYVNEENLKRVEELTIRTHQLNTTGYTYSYEELKKISKSKNYRILIAGLKDKFGEYGKIGIALIENKKKIWRIKLFLMSCRVISTGVGSVFLNYIIKCAKQNNVDLEAEYIPNAVNRGMLITYKFTGFYEHSKEDCKIIFRYDDSLWTYPDYLKVIEHVQMRFD